MSNPALITRGSDAAAALWHEFCAVRDRAQIYCGGELWLTAERTSGSQVYVNQKLGWQRSGPIKIIASLGAVDGEVVATGDVYDSLAFGHRHRWKDSRRYLRDDFEEVASGVFETAYLKRKEMILAALSGEANQNKRAD